MFLSLLIKKKTVILTAPYGQTSNRFLQHIHLDSFCRENGINFYNPFLADYYHNYPNLKLQVEKNIGKSLLKAFYKFRWKSTEFNDEQKSKNYEEEMLKRKILFCHGMFFRSFETTEKSRPFYQKLFDPGIDKETLKKTWLTKSDNQEKIVAIHVRRGDYENFKGGIFFYSDDVYLDKMKHMLELLNNNCRFIIFSNDQAITRSTFSTLSCIFEISYNSYIVDHYLMAHCDYIIGPPSTFSLWASYIGKVLYYHMYNSSDKPDLNQFAICRG